MPDLNKKSGHEKSYETWTGVVTSHLHGNRVTPNDLEEMLDLEGCGDLVVDILSMKKKKRAG